MEYRLRKKIYYKPKSIITIQPFFDIHLGNSFCDEDAVVDYVHSIAGRNTYLIGGGDMMDMVITSDIKRYTKTADKSKTQAIVDEQIDKMENILSPMKGNIIGLGSGNHESNILKRCGTDPVERLCNHRRLNTRYLGYSWLVRLVLENEKTGNQKHLVIRGHHGWGGGSRTQGADLTKYSKDCAYYDADIFLYGHVHRRMYDEFPRLGITKDNQLYARPKLIFLCGSYLKTLSDGPEATYSEQAGYPPISIGGIPFDIDANGDRIQIETKIKATL